MDRFDDKRGKSLAYSFTRVFKVVTAALALMLAERSVSAEDYHWPDKIPPEAADLMKPLPLSPKGQPVPGYPEGPDAVSPDTLTFTQEQKDKIKAGHFTAAIAIHTMDAGWPKLQIEGITNTLKDLGVDVVAVTNAHFKPGQQISDLEQLTARKPNVIFSIPIDPQSEAEAYKKVAASGIKLVFMDNVPVGMAPGKDYVSVTASDNERNAYYASKELTQALGGQGEVGIITLVYDYYYSVAVRKTGALAAFKESPGIKVDEIGTVQSPEKAYQVATAMLTAHPDLKGMFVAWDTPAEQVVAAAKALGRKIIIVTNDIADDSALYVARGDFFAVGAQRPYDQGVSEAKSAALALIGEKVPPYLSVPTLRVKKIDLLSALKAVTKEDPPASVVKICNNECF